MVHEIEAGTEQWSAWWQHYGNTKQATRMLACLAKDPPVYVAPSEWPPELKPLEPALRPLVGAGGRDACAGETGAAEPVGR